MGRGLRGLLLYLSASALLVGFEIGPLFSVQVPNAGMEPTIHKGQTIFVTALDDATIEDVAIGDVVVFRVPGRKDDLLVKRIVAMPGDELEIRDKRLFRNGEPVAEPYAQAVDERIYTDGERHAKRDQLAPLKIPDGEVFLLGDNRDQSYDSRFFGNVPISAIAGKVE